MTEALMNQIKEQLVRHEGLRLKPYRCTVGKLTIGYGRNLDDCGISQTEAYLLLENDIQNCEKQLQSKIPDIYNGLDEVRKSVLLNMCISICRLYLEYTAYNSISSQFPVTISQLPKCPDDLHEYPTKVKFSLESRYIGSPGYIDFGIIIITDFDETVIGQT